MNGATQDEVEYDYNFNPGNSKENLYELIEDKPHSHSVTNIIGVNYGIANQHAIKHSINIPAKPDDIHNNKKPLLEKLYWAAGITIGILAIIAALEKC